MPSVPGYRNLPIARVPIYFSVGAPIISMCYATLGRSEILPSKHDRRREMTDDRSRPSRTAEQPHLNILSRLCRCSVHSGQRKQPMRRAQHCVDEQASVQAGVASLACMERPARHPSDLSPGFLQRISRTSSSVPSMSIASPRERSWSQSQQIAA
jgi:hypothetical protein